MLGSLPSFFWNGWTERVGLSCIREVPGSNLGLDTYYKKTSWPLVRKQAIPTERPPLVGEVSVNICG
jgi:hypothetical protein